MTSIIDLPDIPLYSIKSVADQTGIQSVTLRAWERRHEVLTPHRAENRYRLYSERDIAILRWLKDKVDGDTSIGLAVLELREMIRRGDWPEVSLQPKIAEQTNTAVSSEKYIRLLFNHLIARDENAADADFRQIQLNFSVDAICLEIITPVLHAVGDAWERGEIPISIEHFSSAYLRGKLSAILQSMPVKRSAPLLLAGGAPGEQHEIPALIAATLFRRQGYRVEYLGPDLPLDDLVDYALYQRPAMIILSATMQPAAQALTKMGILLKKARLETIFGFGGQAFTAQPDLIRQIQGEYLGDSLAEAQHTLQRLVPCA